jgi:predicted NUDIX family NTP pyrophosphohydrolase
MPKQSAGLLVYRRGVAGLEVLLAHPGGPFWAKKDLGAWSVPKGEFGADEAPRDAALREFAEEMGPPPAGSPLALTPVRQKAGKIVHAFAVEGTFDAAGIKSNTFEMEWPPRSGRMQTFPEVDRAQWFPLDEARRRIQPSQQPILDELASRLGAG